MSASHDTPPAEAVAAATETVETDLEKAKGEKRKKIEAEVALRRAKQEEQKAAEERKKKEEEEEHAAKQKAEEERSKLEELAKKKVEEAKNSADEERKRKDEEALAKKKAESEPDQMVAVYLLPKGKEDETDAAVIPLDNQKHKLGVVLLF